jgi:Protein of unknown function (DUF2868)
MRNSANTPALQHLYQLSQQLEADREQSAELLRQRDHEIGRDCHAGDDAGRLLFWLQRVQKVGIAPSDSWLNESAAAMLLRASALLFGALTMLGFLLASGRGLVNVFLFLMLFVLLQLLFALGAGVVMLRSLRGKPPASFPLNPARFVTARALPDKRYLGEAAGVLRLLLLRYGQEFGALFTVGAVVAFLCLLAFADFSFVWGSTFGVSDQLVTSVTGLLSAPWSGWAPVAVLSPELIADTRYNPAVIDLSQMNDDSRRGWWPFLLMCMLVYGLLPRLLLWLASRLAYGRELKRSFVSFPGAELVLSRMKRPMVKTQAEEAESDGPAQPVVALDTGLALLNWAGALGEQGEQGEQQFEQLRAVLPGNQFSGGVGSPEEDADSIAAVNRLQPETLLVVVKSWEPPLADLADVLCRVTETPRCSLCLVPLPGREVSEHALDEWEMFASELPFASVSAQALNRV